MLDNDKSSFMNQRLFTIMDVYELGFIGSIALDALTKKYSHVKVTELDETWDGDNDIRKAILSNKPSALDSACPTGDGHFASANGNIVGQMNNNYDVDFNHRPVIQVYNFSPDNEQDDSFFIVKIDNSQEEEYYNINDVEAVIHSMNCKPVWLGDSCDKPATTFTWFDASEIDDE